MMRLLLENGADPDIRNANGKRPQDLLPDAEEGRTVGRLFYEPREKWRSKKAQKIPALRNPFQDEKQICDKFFVNVRFYSRQGVSWWETVSVHSLLYDAEKDKLTELEESFRGIRGSTEEEIKSDDIWRWIHFPANNVSCLYPDNKKCRQLIRTQMTWVQVWFRRWRYVLFACNLFMRTGLDIAYSRRTRIQNFRATETPCMAVSGTKYQGAERRICSRQHKIATRMFAILSLATTNDYVYYRKG